MEFAHLNGYDGVAVSYDDRSAFQGWEDQIDATEAVTFSNPLRYFPLFSYDPRRYRLPDKKTPGDKGCAAWDKPFARIVGCKDSASGINKIWLGFCMNPLLGFRPFDEFCEHLPRFYKKCADDDIPIVAHCVPGGFIPHDVEYYRDELSKRIDKSKERHEMMLKEKLSSTQNNALSSNMYCGEEYVVGDNHKHYCNRRPWQ